jgi:hypothetical protein
MSYTKLSDTVKDGSFDVPFVILLGAMWVALATKNEMK